MGKTPHEALADPDDMMAVTIDDLKPFPDMLAAYREQQIDGLDARTALDHLAVLESIETELKAALSYTRGEMLRALEAGDVVVAGVTYSRKPKLKKRANHARVRVAVREKALVDPSNNKPITTKGAAAAVERAVQFMHEMYLSDSSLPKVGELKRHGIPYESVIGEEQTGWELDVR